MIGNSLHEYLFIRVAIVLLQYTTPICLSCLAIFALIRGVPALSHPASQVILAYCLLDILYATFIWIPYNRRLRDETKYPPPLTPKERSALFHKTLEHIPDFERYLHLWFLGADEREIRRDNIRDFILWAFFDSDSIKLSDEEAAEVDGYIDNLEQRLGRKIEPGRGKAESLRLTIDDVETRYRSLVWFVIIGGVDFVAHCQFTWNGFQHHALPILNVFSVIPPRLQSIFARHRSPSKELSYWYRPHTATDKLPVVFLHGIGVGLWTYVPFLAKLNKSASKNDQIGVIAVEILPISFRLTKTPLEKLEFLSQLEIILESHGWDQFVVATHSYGSVLATHLIKSPTFARRIRAVVLTDPVSIMLHQPDVAYNFTRRKPRHGNEWQLWYFASMDPGVAHALGRHFFWRENIIWKEELLNFPEASTSDSPLGAHEKQRKVAVSLSGRDLIVDTFTVAQYLAEGEDWIPGEPGAGADEHGQIQSGTRHLTRDGIEILWFPGLDHAQIFDNPKDEERVSILLRQYCAL